MASRSKSHAHFLNPLSPSSNQRPADVVNSSERNLNGVISALTRDDEGAANIGILTQSQDRGAHHTAQFEIQEIAADTIVEEEEHK